jgi:murein DD-endopeptidase MepM/ murein hydrolase activator NlpD
VFQLCSPLDGETLPELWEIVSAPYAPPPPGRDERHHGVDFAHYRRKGLLTIAGVRVQAVLPGVAAASIIDRLPYGNVVIVETAYSEFPPDLAAALNLEPGQSLYHLYAHMQNPPQVRLGQTVTCGQWLGEVGKTGYDIVNPHLHFETRLGPAGATFESMAFYDTGATEQEMDTYKLWRTSGAFQHFDPMTLFASYLRYVGEAASLP